MIHCFDLDGTITTHSGYGVSELKLPWFFFWIILRFYNPPVNKKIVVLIDSIKKEGGDVVIITSRPKELQKITEAYLRRRNIIFDGIFFLGTGPGFSERKIEKLKEIGASFFYENNINTVNQAKKEGFNTSLI